MARTTGFSRSRRLLAGADEVTAINTADCPEYPENLSFAAKERHVTPNIIIDDFQVHRFADKYDVILFLGVLYHLENIFAAMRSLHQLFPNEAAMKNLAYGYDFTCERLEGIYTKDYPSRGVFKLNKLAPVRS